MSNRNAEDFPGLRVSESLAILDELEVGTPEDVVADHMRKRWAEERERWVRGEREA